MYTSRIAHLECAGPSWKVFFFRWFKCPVHNLIGKKKMYGIVRVYVILFQTIKVFFFNRIVLQVCSILVNFFLSVLGFVSRDCMSSHVLLSISMGIMNLLCSCFDVLHYWRFNLILLYNAPRYTPGNVVPRGTALCGATLHPPEAKSCRIIWCVVQREHILENRCVLRGLKCFLRLLSMQFIQNKSFWIFYCAFYKDILHFLNPNTVPKFFF